jgi:hypothetical protein
MSFLLNVVGDIHGFTRDGVAIFNTTNTPETVMDIIQISSEKKEYYFKYRLSNMYLYATGRRELFVTSNRDQAATRFLIDPQQNRIVDYNGFKYEVVVQNVVISEILETKAKRTEVEHPDLKPDEIPTVIQPVKIPPNFNPNPSNPLAEIKWDPTKNTEIYLPDRSKPAEVIINKELMKENNSLNNLALEQNPNLSVDDLKEKGLYIPPSIPIETILLLGAGILLFAAISK